MHEMSFSSEPTGISPSPHSPPHLAPWTRCLCFLVGGRLPGVGLAQLVLPGVASVGGRGGHVSSPGAWLWVEDGAPLLGMGHCQSRSESS